MEKQDKFPPNESVHHFVFYRFKGTLSGLRRFLPTESPLKMMKKLFHFISFFRSHDI